MANELEDDEITKAKGRRLTNIGVSEVTTTARAANRRVVTLKSEDMATDNQPFLDVGDGPPQSDEALDAALRNAEVGNSSDPATEDVATTEEVLSGDPEEVVTDEDIDLTPDSNDGPEQPAETAPAVEDASDPEEMSSSDLLDNVISLALAMEESANDAGREVAIAKAVDHLEILAGGPAKALLADSEKLSSVIRKSAAAALRAGIESVKDVSGIEGVDVAKQAAVSIFKSLRVEDPKVVEESQMKDRLAALRKCFDTIDSVLPKAAPTRRPSASSHSRTERQPQPTPQVNESPWDDDDIND